MSDSRSAVPKTEKSTMRVTRHTIEITKPAIAFPLGRLNMPINENRKPRNHKMRFATGTQHNTRPRMDSTRPALPGPFFCLTGWGWEAAA